MSQSIKCLALVGMLALLAACDTSRQEEFVIVEPEPISIEPTYTGKYD